MNVIIKYSSLLINPSTTKLSRVLVIQLIQSARDSCSSRHHRKASEKNPICRVCFWRLVEEVCTVTRYTTKHAHSYHFAGKAILHIAFLLPHLYFILSLFHVKYRNTINFNVFDAFRTRFPLGEPGLGLSDKRNWNRGERKKYQLSVNCGIWPLPTPNSPITFVYSGTYGVLIHRE